MSYSAEYSLCAIGRRPDPWAEVEQGERMREERGGGVGCCGSDKTKVL